MVHNVPARNGPWFDSTPPVASTRVSHEAWVDTRITLRKKMWTKQLFDERLFGLALDMDEQSRHAVRSFPSASGVGRPPSSFFSQSSPRL